jgi:hypothetical protein
MKKKEKKEKKQKKEVSISPNCLLYILDSKVIYKSNKREFKYLFY